MKKNRAEYLQDAIGGIDACFVEDAINATVIQKKPAAMRFTWIAATVATVATAILAVALIPTFWGDNMPDAPLGPQQNIGPMNTPGESTSETTPTTPAESTSETTPTTLEESSSETTPNIIPETTPKTPEDLETLPMDGDLIKELNQYLDYYDADIDFFPYTIADRINSIKNGEVAFRIEFDTAPLYYACAYYDGEHEYESDSFCCIYEHPYTWIGIENFEDIPESYEGKKLIATVQIGGTNVCENIMNPEDTQTRFQHYLLYSPPAVSAFESLGEQFIILGSNDSDSIYYCTDKTFVQYYIRWIMTGGECYILLPDDEYYLKIQLGEYYDELAPMIIKDTYSEEKPNGTIFNYSLLKFDDFVEFLNRKIGETEDPFETTPVETPGETYPSYVPPSDELKAKSLLYTIIDAHLESISCEQTEPSPGITLRYYGKYKSDNATAHVMFIDNPTLVYTEALWSETLGGQTFTYYNGQCLEVYIRGSNDNRLCTLKEAYESGAITDEHLAELNERYKNGEPTVIREHDYVLEAVKEELIMTYYEGTNKGKLPSAFKLRYLGCYNDAYVVFVDYGQPSLEAWYTIQVGDHIFEYPNSQMMHVYYNDSFYTLESAFEGGILTNDDLAVIKEIYSGKMYVVAELN